MVGLKKKLQLLWTCLCICVMTVMLLTVMKNSYKLLTKDKSSRNVEKAIQSFCNVYNLTTSLKDSKNINCTLMSLNALPEKYWVCETKIKKKAIPSLHPCNSYLQEEILDTLTNFPEVGLVDISTDTSCYGLPIAVSGHQVLIRMSKKEEFEVLQHSLLKNSILDKVTVISNILVYNLTRHSDVERRLSNMHSQFDQDIGQDKPIINQVVSKRRSNSIYSNEILDIIPFHHTVMLVQMGSNTHNFFDFNFELLVEKLMVYAVFVQWRYMKLNINRYSNYNIERVLRVMVTHHYAPWSLKADGRTKLDVNDWAMWPDYVVWIMKPQNFTTAS